MDVTYSRERCTYDRAAVIQEVLAGEELADRDNYACSTLETETGFYLTCEISRDSLNRAIPLRGRVLVVIALVSLLLLPVQWMAVRRYVLDEGTEVKGAVIIAPGGGHMYRSNVEEGYEVAQALNEQGYQCFILNYRVDPYTDEESALAADIYAGDTNASALVESYVPDEIDAVSSDVNAYLAIYSVTPDEITNENFPATFFAFGSDDANLWDWGTRCFNLVRDTGIQTEIHTYAGVPHGFGAGTDAGNNYYANAATWPMLADCFLDNVYANADAAEAAAAEETTEAAAEEATETVTEEATETAAE